MRRTLTPEEEEAFTKFLYRFAEPPLRADGKLTRGCLTLITKRVVASALHVFEDYITDVGDDNVVSLSTVR